MEIRKENLELDKTYYVVDAFVLGGDAWRMGVFDTEAEAIRRAQDDYDRLTAQEKRAGHDVEIKVYGTVYDDDEEAIVLDEVDPLDVIDFVISDHDDTPLSPLSYKKQDVPEAENCSFELIEADDEVADAVFAKYGITAADLVDGDLLQQGESRGEEDHVFITSGTKWVKTTSGVYKIK